MNKKVEKPTLNIKIDGAYTKPADKYMGQLFKDDGKSDLEICTRIEIV